MVDFGVVLIFRASVASKEIVRDKNPRTWEELSKSTFPETLKTLDNGQVFLRHVFWIIMYTIDGCVMV